LATTSEEIKRSLMHKILIGQYPLGSTLPSCRELAAELGINRNTASKIYRELAREGLVRTVPGHGVVVISQRGSVSPVPGVRERLLAAAREARLMGMERSAFLEAAQSVADELFGRTRPSIAFVECNQEDAEALAREIAAELSLPLQPVLLSAVQRAPEGILGSYDIVCTTLYHLLAVKAALGEADDRVVAVHAPPDPRGLLEIASVEPSTRIGVVCAQPTTQQYLVSALGMLHPGQVRTCLLSDCEGVRALQHQVDVVVDVPSCHKQVAHLLPGMRIVTVGFHIDVDSLGPLRDAVARYLSDEALAV